MISDWCGPTSKCRNAPPINHAHYDHRTVQDEARGFRRLQPASRAARALLVVLVFVVCVVMCNVVGVPDGV